MVWQTHRPASDKMQTSSLPAPISHLKRTFLRLPRTSSNWISTSSALAQAPRFTLAGAPQARLPSLSLQTQTDVSKMKKDLHAAFSYRFAVSSLL